MSLKLSVPTTVGMSELLNDPVICKNFFRSAESLKQVICQVQLDIANEENRDTVGPTIVALKNFLDILLLFAAKGALLIKEENNKTQ